jgi:hypothetical protein
MPDSGADRAGGIVCPKGNADLAALPSWSVFERRRSMTRPSLVKERWAKSIAASSERRKALAKPTRHQRPVAEA